VPSINTNANPMPLMAQKTAIYNDAVAQVYRIDAIVKNCHGLRRSGQLDEYFWELNALKIELSPDMMLKHKSDPKIISTDLQNSNDFFSRCRDFENKCEVAKKKQDRSAYYRALCDYEMYLRAEHIYLGKGAQYKDIEEAKFY